MEHKSKSIRSVFCFKYTRHVRVCARTGARVAARVCVRVGLFVCVFAANLHILSEYEMYHSHGCAITMKMCVRAPISTHLNCVFFSSNRNTAPYKC